MPGVLKFLANNLIFIILEHELFIQNNLFSSYADLIYNQVFPQHMEHPDCILRRVDLDRRWGGAGDDETDRVSAHPAQLRRDPDLMSPLCAKRSTQYSFLHTNKGRLR